MGAPPQGNTPVVDSAAITDDSIVNADINSAAAIAGSKLADDAISLSKMASGTDGELITYDANGDPAAVAVGTATHVLTSNGAGAAPTFQAAAGGTETQQNPIIIPPWVFKSIIQGSWVREITDLQYYCGDMTNGSSMAQNDELSYKVWIPEGTYTIYMVAVTDTNHGVTHIEIDTTEVGTMDWYNGSTLRNVVKSIASVNITTSGLKDFDVKLATKNGSASAYNAQIALIWLERTGDST